MRRSTHVVSIIFFLAACGNSGGTRSAAAAPSSVTASPDSNFPVTPIHDVQGAGATSPMNGQTVTVSGIVTGDFQDNKSDSSLRGFFLQEEEPDNDSLTSEGIFVYDKDANGLDVRVGDRVNVVGVIKEYFGETQLIAAQVDVTGAGSVEITTLTLPVSGTVVNSDGQLIADLERFEGMLVTLPQDLTVTDLFDLERFGEVSLAANGRLRQFTNANLPDVAAYASYQRSNARRRIIVDDGSSRQFISPARYLHPAGASPVFSLRAGDRLSDLQAVVRFSRGSGSSGVENYRLVPVAEPQFESTNPRPLPPEVGGTVKVMSFNALNYFTTVDKGQKTCGPSSKSGCRGADSLKELGRQRTKIINTILTAGVHIVGLMEIENNQKQSLQTLVDGLNAATGANHWSFVDTGTIGTDAIRVGLIYDNLVVSPVGGFELLDTATDPRFLETKNREALAQTFSAAANGGTFTIAVNHLKSKGSSCDSLGDPNTGDGQGNCNRTRTGAAAALSDWIAGDPTGSDDADVLIIGDLNAYLREDPLREIVAAGFTNLLETFVGTDAYSFIFRGEAGALDHALASATLVPQITGVSEWHINADEPPLLDYNLESGRDDTLFDPGTPFRTSDHDPVMIGLSLTAD